MMLESSCILSSGSLDAKKIAGLLYTVLVQSWPPKQQGLTHGFEKGDDVIASSLSGENFFAC